MSQLRYFSLQDLIHSEHDAGLAFLFRHAERSPLITREDVITADLTEQGYRDARAFGHRLASHRQIGRVFSSPIQRCIHTAQAILDGAGVAASIQLKWWLYSPNLRVAQKEMARATGSIQMSSPDQELIVDPGQIRTLLQRVKVPHNPDQINLYIAHDTTVLPVLAYLLDLETVSLQAVPGYLEGILLAVRDGRLEITR